MPNPIQSIQSVKSRKEIVLARIQEILREHDGLESNIPANQNHEYWNLLNEYRSL